MNTQPIDQIASQIIEYTSVTSGSLLPSRECVPNMVREAVACALYQVAAMLTGDITVDSRMIERFAENIMSASRLGVSKESES